MVWLRRLWLWMITPSKEDKELFESLNKLEYKGWVVKVTGGGAISKYYDPEKDQTPNKDGWDVMKGFREKYPNYKDMIEMNKDK